jgi:acetoin utilization protein AcuC
VNIPLRAGTDDEVYLATFEAIVPPLIERYRPDVVFAQIGGDSHREDHFAHLNITGNGYKQVIREIRALSPKIMALGGGGYNIFKTSALWALAWSVLTGSEPEDKFSDLVGGMMYRSDADAGSLEDPPFILQGWEKDLCVTHAESVIRYIRENVFPIHRLG